MLMPLRNPPHINDDSEDESNEDKRTLFCANLDERVTEDLLYEVFLQAGPIESAKIPKDQNGRQRSFGFVTYVHACAVQYAMQLFQGLSLYRKTLAIKFQGSTNFSPMRNITPPGYNHQRINFDNSSLRGINFMTYNEKSPEFYSNSMMPQQSTNISKHASTQRRSHSSASPYQRNTSSNNERYRERDRERDRQRDRDRDRDHDRRRHYNNDSNRNSDQRSGGKSRR